MADDGLREIQLSGKQLLAVFMTAAVLLVVTFLCGVLVGRGVRAQKEPTLAAAAGPKAAVGQDPTIAAALEPSAAPSRAAGEGATAAPPPSPPEEDLTYYKSLEGRQAPEEAAKPLPAGSRAGATGDAAAGARPDAAAGAAAKTAAPSGQPAGAPAMPAPRNADAAAGADPPGPGYVVKIVAYREKAQSDALATRLRGKGYSAYVVAVTGRGAPLYSVRVGRFKTREDAEAARKRLEKEEQFKPLITR